MAHLKQTIFHVKVKFPSICILSGYGMRKGDEMTETTEIPAKCQAYIRNCKSAIADQAL